MGSKRSQDMGGGGGREGGGVYLPFELDRREMALDIPGAEQATTDPPSTRERTPDTGCLCSGNVGVETLDADGVLQR